MGAPTDDQIHAFIACEVNLSKAASAKKKTLDYALSEVQEMDISGNFHSTGSSKAASTQTENYIYVRGQTWRQQGFSDKNSVSNKWVLQDNEESHSRPHHGQEFVDAGTSVAELEFNEISKCQSNQQPESDYDQSLRDRRANLPASQPSATMTQSPSNTEVSACWPKPKPQDWEEDDTSPGMNESHGDSDGSCETEDSCDYSSGTEDPKAAFTPLSKRFLKEAANSFENKNGDEVPKVQKAHKSSCFQRLKELIIAKQSSENQMHGQHSSNETSIITIDSDSEDEYVASSEMVATSGLDSAGDPEGAEQRRPNHLLTEVIVIDSDTEDDGDQSIEKSTTERASSSVGEDSVVLVTPDQHDQWEKEASADILQSGSQGQDTPEDIPKDLEEGKGPCYESLHGAQLTARTDVCDKVENKIVCSDAFERTKNVTSHSNGGENSRQSAPSSSKNGENQELDLPSKKLKTSFGNSVKTPLEIPPPADYLTTGSKKKTDASEKSQLWLSQKKKKGEDLSKLKLGTPLKPSVDKNVEQLRAQSKPLSPTTKRDLSISTSRSILSSTKNCSPPAEGSSRSREPTSANCNRKKPKRVTFAPEPHSPFKRLARSRSAPSTSETSATSVFSHQVISPDGFSPCAATKSSPRMKVLEDWTKTHYPIRLERKYHQGVEQNQETTKRTVERINHTSNTDSDGPVRPEVAQHCEVPRQRRRSQDSNTSLMKRCKNEAMEWSKAIHRQPAQRKSGFFQSFI